MDEQQSTGSEFLQTLASALSERLLTNEDVQFFVENFIAAYNKPKAEQHNDDFLFDIIKPAVISLIRFKDDTAKELRYLQDFIADKSCANEGTEYAVEILEGVLGGIDDTLLGYDVEPYRCEDTKFNPHRQNVVKKITTDDAEKVKTVAESLSDGYERKGAIVSKERVSVYAAKTNTEGEV